MRIELLLFPVDISFDLGRIESCELTDFPKELRSLLGADRRIGEVQIRRTVLALQVLDYIEARPSAHEEVELRLRDRLPLGHAFGLVAEEDVDLKADAF